MGAGCGHARLSTIASPFNLVVIHAQRESQSVAGMYEVEKPSVSVSTWSMKATGGYSCGAKQMGNPRVFENYKKLGPIRLDFSFRYWAIVGSVLGIMGLCWAI
ncbi:uncharacterized protein [Gossypium hirsutum]|uniref:Uncharacterized protein isoform X1 n=1 Tax=Gossypium hirsutum TaxID=3635 RepID=A0ABM3BBK5_GOSHI|nr:uncharacterized protein LOC121224691 isoform X1 [Gossypium hirsutum]